MNFFFSLSSEKYVKSIQWICCMHIVGACELDRSLRTKQFPSVSGRHQALVALLDLNQQMWTLLFFNSLYKWTPLFLSLEEFGGDTCTKPETKPPMVSTWYVQKWSKRAKQMSWQTMYHEVRIPIASLWSYKKVRISQAKMFEISLPRDKRNSTSSKLCPLHTCLSCLRPICSCHALGG